MTNKGIGALKGADKVFLIGLLVWIALQVSRAIALTLIDSIDAGTDSVAWLYPAYLDLFAVAFAPPLIWAVWKRRGLLTWAAAIMYLTISIIDHVGNFVTTTFVSAPSIAEGMDPYLVPVIQTVLDIVFLVLLFVPRFRNLFFRIEKPSV
jgi:hypothetical protein